MLQLPLVKFSWSVHSEDETSFSWTSAQDDLICVVDSFRCPQSNAIGSASMMLRVVQRAQTLEELDLIGRIKSAQQAQESARQHHIELQGHQLPIFALYRSESVTIALKYNLTNKMVRRIQMRFISAEHFQHMLDCLKTLGCHLTEHKASVTPSVALSHVQPVTAIPNSFGTNQPIANIPRPQTAAPSTSTVRKTPARSRTTTKKKSQVPVLPALPLTATTGHLSPELQFQSHSMPTAQSFVNQSSSVIGEKSIYFQNENSGLMRHATIANFPLSQPTGHANEIQQTTCQPRTPIVSGDSVHPKVGISLHDQGNATFAEQLNPTNSPLPPRRALPFARPSSVPKPVFAAQPSSSNVSSATSKTVDNGPRQAPTETIIADAASQLPPPNATGNPSVFSRPTLAQLAESLAPPLLSDMAKPVGHVEAQPGLRPSVASMQEAFRGPNTLVDYSSLPEEQRWAIVEQGIIACLKDDNFVQFCEDLSCMWSRIGLDMKIEKHFNA